MLMGDSEGHDPINPQETMPKVYEGQSIIPNIGKGLFAARDIAKDEVIVEYLGELLKPDQKPRNDRSNIYFNDGTILCCHDNDLASFANDCIDAPTNPRRLIGSLRKSKPFYERYQGANLNAEIHLEEDQHKAFLYARQDIKKDEEIFCHYGFPYWFNYEATNIGFELEKEVERNGFPDDLFKYAAFHAYVKDFYPNSKGFEYKQGGQGFIVMVRFEGEKGLILQMPRLSQCFSKYNKTTIE